MDPPADKKPNGDPPPATDVERKPERIEGGKEGGPNFRCDLYDTVVSYKIAQEFIPGLATACIDSTMGGFFKSPVTVAVEMRRDMIEYLTKRSESFVAESVILSSDPQAEISDHPCDIARLFIDDFTMSKRNWLSRVSGWLQSEKREDQIDDFQQQLEKNEFWSMEKRGPISQTLLKNVDLKSKYHCDMKFNSPEELAEHATSCGFRIIECTSVGCMSKYIVAHMEKHDETCPYKVLPCEQKCPVSVMRRDMDKHCITDCPMKIVNCPFYSLGCEAAIPQCSTDQHRVEALQSHLMFILKAIYKEASTEDLEKRVQQLQEISSTSELAESQNARSLNQLVKNLDAKLEPLAITNKSKDGEEASSTGKGSEEVGNAAEAVENTINAAGEEKEEANDANKASEEATSTSKAGDEASEASKSGEEANGPSKEVTATNKVVEDIDHENKVAEKASDESNAGKEVTADKGAP